MGLSDEKLMQYKEYLKTCNYANITQMTESAVKKLFEKENRVFLLTWMLCKIIPSYNDRLELAKKNNKLESTLANFVYENGFCEKSEKDAFVSHGIDVNTEKQIKIFDRIFYMLSSLHADNSDKENTTPEINDLKNLFSKLPNEPFESRVLGMRNPNLFPTFGPIVKMTNEERNDKIKKFKADIDKVEEEIKEAEIKKQQVLQSFEKLEACEIATDEEIDSMTAKLCELTSQFKENFAVINSNITNDNDNISYKNSELETFIKSSSKELNEILAVLEKKESLNKILSDEDLFQQETASTKNDLSKFICEKYELSENIIEEMKQNNVENM